MKIINFSNKTWGLIVGWVFLTLFHFFSIAQYPGFHFDEAWAALWAHRIYAESGFNPFQAQSPYANSISHYLAALGFRFLGTSVWTFRVINLLWVIAGLIMIQVAIFRVDRKVAYLYPWVVMGGLGLYLNHRFAIEINTFHVFCFGLFILSFTVKSEVVRWSLLFVSIVLGVLSHLLFLAPVLAGLATRATNPKVFTKTEKGGVSVLALMLIPYALYLSGLVPERDKLYAMVLGAVAVVSWVFVFEKVRLGPRVHYFLKVIAIPFLVFSLFFIEGHWSLAVFTSQSNFGLVFVFRIFLLIGLSYLSLKKAPKEIVTFLIFLLLTTGALMLKPAPRYFELAMVMLTVIFCIEFSKRSRLWLAVWVLSSIWSFLGDGLGRFSLETFREKEIKVGMLKDHTKDFWPIELYFSKNEKTRCELRRSFSGDHRLSTVLSFLRLSSVEPNSCRENFGVQVERLPEGRLTLSP